MPQLPVLDISKFLFAEKKEDFYANRLSKHLKEHHHNIDKPHKHNSYLVVLFTKGTGIHEVDFNSYKVKPGSVFLLQPGQIHHWELSKDAEGYIFLHSKNYYNQPYSHNTLESFPFFYSTQNSPCIYLKPERLSVIQPLFATLVDEFYSEKILKYRKICSVMDVLYIELSRLYIGGNFEKVANSSNYSMKLKEFEQLINEHFIKEKLPSFYASRMNITTKHLNRITQTLVGKTATLVIFERVVLEAKRMLLHADHNIAEIADLLGYADYSYFTRMFKKMSGETPTEFANRYR